MAEMTPAFPAAEMMRPQFGSEPAMAVFTKGEFAILRAIRAAVSSLAAPVTSMVTSFRAPRRMQLALKFYF